MLNAIPVIGWLFSFGAAVSLSVPFWFCWTFWGLGSSYFGFLPAQYQVIPFWHCVGLFTIVWILKGLAPTLVSNTNTITPSKEEKKPKEVQ